MSLWRKWDPSNKPGTCKWCGRKLARPKTSFTPDGRFIENVKDRPPVYSKPGGFGDGHFCGLRCGYEFGVAQVGLGHLIAPRKPKVTA